MEMLEILVCCMFTTPFFTYMFEQIAKQFKFAFWTMFTASIHEVMYERFVEQSKLAKAVS